MQEYISSKKSAPDVLNNGKGNRDRTIRGMFYIMHTKRKGYQIEGC